MTEGRTARDARQHHARVMSVNVVEILVQLKRPSVMRRRWKSGWGIDQRRCEFGHCLSLHVAVLQLPLVAGFEKHGCDQTDGSPSYNAAKIGLYSVLERDSLRTRYGEGVPPPVDETPDCTLRGERGCLKLALPKGCWG